MDNQELPDKAKMAEQKLAGNTKLRVKCEALTHVGQYRKNNEDAYTFSAEQQLYVVADGMGGAAAGELASCMTVDAIEAYVKPELLNVDSDGIFRVLDRAIKDANIKVWSTAQNDPRYQGMGTTVTLALVREAKLYLAYVGDSRAYMMRDGTIWRLTEDQTLVNELVKANKLTPEEALYHPQRSILMRALGVRETVQADFLSTDLYAGDGIILCTDGLTEYLDNQTILDIWQKTADLHSAAQQMIDEANFQGGSDNITLILLRVEAVNADENRQTVAENLSSKEPANRPRPVNESETVKESKETP